MSSLQPYLRVTWFYVGLTVVALGYALIITAGLGAAPWDVFHLSISLRTGLSLALVSQGTGLMIIGMGWIMGIRPTVGMVLNMLTLGPMMQGMLMLMRMPDSIVARWLMLGAGIFIAGIGVALYVSAGIGSGPRDGMMIGLTQRLKLPVSVIRNGIDIAVALMGWWLGGPLGIGSVLVALGTGPAVQLGMKMVARLATYPFFTGFVRPVQLGRS